MHAVIVAFVAAAVNTGRTSMVANLGWILASRGLRVLVLDWGTEQPTVHHYLNRFVRDDARPADEVLGRATTDALLRMVGLPAADDEDRDALRVQRYSLPRLPGTIDVVSYGDPAATSSGRSELAGNVTTRDALRALDYDYVLMDSPTAASGATTALIAQLCDVAVVNFTLLPETLVGAERLVRSLLDEGPDGIKIVAVPALFETGTSAGARQDQDLVHGVFGELLRRQSLSGHGDSGNLSTITLVEIPYQPQYVAHQRLAVLLDEPGVSSQLAAGYERVAAAVTSGRITHQEPVSSRVRSRYRVALGLAKPEPSDAVWLAYAQRDRLWADWVATQLRMAGAQVWRLSGDVLDAGTPREAVVLVLMSEHFATSQAHQRLVQLAQSTPAPGALDLIGVRISGSANVEECAVAQRVEIELNGCAEAVARRRLLETVGLFEPTTATARPGAPFPKSAARSDLTGNGASTAFSARRSADSGVPLRNPRFVGQEDLLEALRDHFLPLDRSLPAEETRCVRLVGPSGAGKSELAREYAHQFAPAYDSVWWINATDRQSVRTRLSELAVQLGADRSPAAALGHWKDHPGTSRSERWLLVYDDARQHAIEGLLPEAGPVHVIVTTADDSVSAGRQTIPVEGLNPADSGMLLRSSLVGIPDLREDQALAVAEAVGPLPLALQLGATWLREFSARLQQQHLAPPHAIAAAVNTLLTRLDDHDSGSAPGSAPMERLLALSVDTLRESKTNPITVALAQMCLFLAPAGVAIRLLRSRTMLAELAAASAASGDLLIRDEVELDRVLWAGARFGLFELDHGNPATLRMHQALRPVLRSMMEPAQLRTRQAQVLRGLAAYVPPDSEDDARDAVELLELQKHLEPSGATTVDFAEMKEVLGPADEVGSGAWDVRHWIVRQIRYLFHTGDRETWRTAAELAESIEKQWTDAFGGTDYQRSQLAVQKANLYRALGRRADALQVDTAVLSEQRRDLGLLHPRTLMTARSMGGDLRALGRFEEALAEDEATWQGFCATFGADHPQTLMVASNLARSRHLMGRVREALELEKNSYFHRVRVLGETHPYVWQSGRDLAFYLSELGRHGEALHQLNKAEALTKSHHTTGDHPEILHIRRVERILRHKTGERLPGRPRKQDFELLVRYQEQLGVNNLYTWACKITYSVDDYLRGDPARAVQLGEDCLGFAVRAFDAEHPYTNACRTNLAVFQRGADRLPQSRTLGEQALLCLQDKLDETHPWALAAAINHAHTLALQGEIDTALDLLGSAHEDCREHLGDDHPSTGIAAGNLLLTQHLSTGEAAPEDLEWNDIFLDLN